MAIHAGVVLGRENGLPFTTVGHIVLREENSTTTFTISSFPDRYLVSMGYQHQMRGMLFIDSGSEEDDLRKALEQDVRRELRGEATDNESVAICMFLS